MKRESILALICYLISCVVARPPAVFLGYQDSLGQYSFGYSAPGSARSEVRTLNGATRGAYSYVDESGIIQSAEYVADGQNGFRVAATNLPQAPLPVEDTPEVIAARTAHLQAVEQARHQQEDTKLRDKSIIESSEDSFKPELSEENSKIKVEEVKKVESSTEQIQERSKEIGEAEETKEEKNAEVMEPSKPGAGIKEIPIVRVAEEIKDDSTISSKQIPIISTHVLLPQVQAGGSPQAIPVFRISHGNLNIEPASISSASITQEDSQGSITPAGTSLMKIISESEVPVVAAKISSDKEAATTRQQSVEEESSKTEAQQENQQQQQQQQLTESISPALEADKAIVAPSLNILPVGSPYSSIISYAPAIPLHYVAFDIL